MQILAELSDFELLLLYLQSSSFACCVRILQYVVDIRRCVSVTQNIEVPASEGLMCDT